MHSQMTFPTDTMPIHYLKPFIPRHYAYHCLPSLKISLTSTAQTSKPSSVTANAAATTDSTSEYITYFSDEWGQRWPTLLHAMEQRTQHCALLNPFTSSSSSPTTILPNSTIASWLPPHSTLKALEYTLSEDTNNGKYPVPTIDETTGLTQYYWIDPASLFPPLLLLSVSMSAGHSGTSVLDMCAAPGGKSLILSQLLFAQQYNTNQQLAPSTTTTTSNTTNPTNQLPVLKGSLLCNEIDSKRRLRLLTVLKAYIPQTLLTTDSVQSSIRVTGRDGKWWGSNNNQEDSFDRILLDAPCSSERHVAQQAAGKPEGPSKADWTGKRCVLLSKEQVKLVLSGLKSLKVGGVLVYSTCSIAGIENDGVVEVVLEKASGSIQVISHTIDTSTTSNNDGTSDKQIVPDFPGTPDQDDDSYIDTIRLLESVGAERTQYGWLLLPDATGWGPIYITVLRKTGEINTKRVKVNKYAKAEED